MSTPEPPALSDRAAVYVVATPAVIVSGPLIVPAGAVVSGTELAVVERIIAPPAPPISAWVASATPTAPQRVAVSGGSAGCM